MAESKDGASAGLTGDSANSTHDAPARTRARGKQRCGAPTRSGAECQAPVVPGKSRCRLHGGHSIGSPGHTNARKHGIYGTYLTTDEIASANDIRARLGTLDEEIELMRRRINRALKAEEQANGNERGGLELQKFVDKAQTEFTAGPEHVYERVDYDARIERLIRRLESLERTRVEMNDAQAKRDAERDDYEPVSQIQVTVINTDGSFTRSDGTIGNVKNGDRP
ncbi:MULTISPECIES: HGGxSTG domain-containing protein [unclassified Burkholderia]|uniref:HGGxSTG domain-containing protein n=1 Tax=unclassified Burkholderia TaxID=2613784 RepID=UPI00163ABAFC|nr:MULTISPECIES: HGGxSTG domain-containing protein [unclassified Burkholderia]